eukprot:6159884-Lingulodinium_polyedra.AAC.1
MVREDRLILAWSTRIVGGIGAWPLVERLGLGARSARIAAECCHVSRVIRECKCRALSGSGDHYGHCH